MEDRRRYERYPVVVGSDINAPSADTMFGLTQDVSRAGARLLTVARYSIGNRLRLNIYLDKDTMVNLTAQVVRGAGVSERGMWRYEIGVNFDEILSDEMVVKLRELSDKLGL